MAASALAVSCSKDKLNTIEEPTNGNPEVKADSYYGYAEISVPAATTSVFVEYQSAGETKVTEIPVTPQVAEPENGKDVEPFGTVQLLVKSSVPAKVSVYSTSNQKDEPQYSLTDFPVDKIQFGSFGETRYVQMPWEFAYTQNDSTNWQKTNSNPDDVVYYDAAHNHTLRYIFCYEGPASEAYYLEEAYTIQDRKVTGQRYDYCGGCGNCAKCMPWGCSCGCNKTNSAFTPSGNTAGGSSTGGNTTGGSTTPTTPTVPTTVTTIQLSEPDSYVTTDEDQTFYHSSGVVMFDDSWPSLPKAGVGNIDADYNDVVVDYDIEAKTVADNILEKEGWREQVKVVLHLRAVGGDYPARVGLVLEGFDQSYVDNIETFVTLDSYQNTHGELPQWVNSSIVPNCIHNESNSVRPWIEMGQIFRMKEAVAGNVAGEYTRIDDNGQTHQTVFNPGLGYWSQPDKTQYEEGISILASKNYYNTTPGYVNVDGGLITYTVIYHMKPRAEMSGEERIAALKNMTDVVTKTTNQNFYIMLNDLKEIGLKGYEPRDSYKSKYEEIVSKNSSNLSSDVTYYSNGGKVWGFKLPVLTKHAWEKYSFGLAYPKYENYIETQGEEDVDWYLYPNGHYLTCWW